jgi:fructose-1,6-bisphosphatase/inositol monophosphatase family enzyme
MLMVAEAGGRVSDLNNQDFNPDMKTILASNGNIHTQMLNLLHAKGTE